jgi:hypothetical protein
MDLGDLLILVRAFVETIQYTRGILRRRPFHNHYLEDIAFVLRVIQLIGMAIQVWYGGRFVIVKPWTLLLALLKKDSTLVVADLGFRPSAPTSTPSS